MLRDRSATQNIVQNFTFGATRIVERCFELSLSADDTARLFKCREALGAISYALEGELSWELLERASSVVLSIVSFCAVLNENPKKESLQ